MRFIIILFLFAPIFSYAQNLKVINNALVYERVFEANPENIEDFLVKNIGNLKDTRDFYKGVDYIKSQFFNAEIDFRSQGGKWGNTYVAIQHPFFANINVQWKEGKYRVIVSNMKTIVSANGMDFPFNDMFVKRGVINGGGIRGQALQYLDNWLTKTFMFEQTKDDW